MSERRDARTDDDDASKTFVRKVRLSSPRIVILGGMVNRSASGRVMRRLARNADRVPGSPTVLAQLAPGQRATIMGVAEAASPVVAARLRQLGFRPASDVEVIRRAPMGDPIIYRVQDTELCLRRREAQLIEVDPRSDA